MFVYSIVQQFIAHLHSI